MSGSYNQKTILDIRQCEFDSAGVQGFWWPFDAEELRNFANDAMFLYGKNITRFESDNPDHLHPYRLISKVFIAELVGLFQADALFYRAQKEGVDLVVPKGTRFWPVVQKGHTPNSDDALVGLRKGPTKTNIFKKLCNVRRIFKILSKVGVSQSGGRISIGGLKIAPITKKILKNNIIATERTSLIVRHARHSKTEVYFQRSDKWYSPVSKYEEKLSYKKNNIEFENAILDGVRNLYKKYDISFPQKSYDYYQTILSYGAALLRVHLHRLIETPEKLPHHVWIGTGGQTWDMMLCLAVRHHGGKSCGHDHATGSGHCAMASISFVDLWGFDNFFTFNATKLEGIKKITEHMPFLERACPAISFPPLDYDEKKIENLLKNKKDIQKIIVMSPPYDRDRGRPSPIMPDIVRLDWQCRLLTFLKKEGYDVILKVHPESRVFPPDKIEEVTGARVSIESFEKMMKEGDLVIFDHIYTSTFRSVLETDMPLTIIQAVNFRLIEEAEGMLKKRAGFVDVLYDENNRLQVDWSELSKEIKKSLSRKSNHNFAETHLAE